MSQIPSNNLSYNINVGSTKLHKKMINYFTNYSKKLENNKTNKNIRQLTSQLTVQPLNDLIKIKNNLDKFKEDIQKDTELIFKKINSIEIYLNTLIHMKKVKNQKSKKPKETTSMNTSRIPYEQTVVTNQEKTPRSGGSKKKSSTKKKSVTKKKSTKKVVKK